jgi:hypothetical protein
MMTLPRSPSALIRNCMGCVKYANSACESCLDGFELVATRRTAIVLGVGIVLVGIGALVLFGHRSRAPDRVGLAFLEGTQALDHGDLPGAAAKFKLATELDGQFCDGYLELGNVYERQGKADPAIRAFEDGLKCLKSDSPHWLFGPPCEGVRTVEIERATRRIEKLKAASTQSH